MFFKNIFLIFFIIFFSWAGFSEKEEGNLFANLSCVKDIKRQYPNIVKGQLAWEEQKRFFHCLHGILELIVDKKIFIHDFSRDYFTREEIKRLFHLYLEFDEESSNKFTTRLLVVKQMLLGGDIDRFKDRELALFYKLIYDYRDAYYIIHKQIPILINIFKNESYKPSPEEGANLLNQIKKTFQTLRTAYQRENVTYSIENIYNYGLYLEQANFLEKSIETELSFSFIHNLIEGTVFPEKEIEGSDWELIFDSFHKTMELFLYYKTYFSLNLSNMELTYLKLESAKIFLSALPINNNKAFPLNNLDQMLYDLVSLFDRKSSNSFISLLKNKDRISFLTRTLYCFSFRDSSKESCQNTNYNNSSSHSVISAVFPDSRFQFFSDKIDIEKYSNSPTLFLDVSTKNLLYDWLINYQKKLSDLQYNHIEEVANNYNLTRWLDSFFEWRNDERMIIGSFYPSDNKEKIYNLLNYQSFLSLLLFSYLPDSYFTNHQKGISFGVWKTIVSEISPLLVLLSGSQGYKSGWKKSFYSLFNISDSFLNSSNRDKHLNSTEILDLATHLMLAIKNSQHSFNIISKLCKNDLNSSCVVSAVLEDKDILSSYPRFQKYIFDFNKKVYIEKIEQTVGELDSKTFSSLSLTALFFLIQIMELNYNLIDQDQSFNLESDELILYSKHFTNSIKQNVPYIFNNEQALSYLMYSFKTGNIPFFTGYQFEPINYTQFHLSFKNFKEFEITPNDFHFLLFDFYNLYKQF